VIMRVNMCVFADTEKIFYISPLFQQKKNATTISVIFPDFLREIHMLL
jgi:hypothetical protein